ncbi:MAG: hypothetical protein GQ524_01525, partial [Anaerolineales bacterium]|nr:hypothetical protein [Anaerolineales bacterium]
IVGISGGAKGLQILLTPTDLLSVTNAVKADFARSAGVIENERSLGGHA